MKARVIDSRHLELDREIPISTGEVFIKIFERKPIKSLRGAWGYDVDSAGYVDNIRKSRKIEPV